MRHRPLHLARRPAPDELEDPEDPDRELDILASYDRGYSFLEAAIDLWQVAGDEARVRAIEAALASAYGVQPPHLEGVIVTLRA